MTSSYWLRFSLLKVEFTML